MSRPRVAVTGLGVKTPAGTSVDAAFDCLLDARSRAVHVPELVARDLAVQFACPVPNFDPAAYFNQREIRRLDRGAQLSVAAAADAIADAGAEGAAAPDRTGVFLGTGLGGILPSTMIALGWDTDPSGMPVDSVARVMPTAPAAWIALRFGFRGPCLTYATACASGATAIGEATLKLRAGEVDMAIAGGVDTPIGAIIVAAFARIGALSLHNDDPAGASRPFEATRDGFVMGEGSSFLVLERWERARARGARIYGEVAGYGSNTDAFHIVAPIADGTVAAACMDAALVDAGLKPADIGHVNAHGTATPLNDRAEAAALVRCFGGRPPPVTAPKGVTGHLIGGAGAFEAAVALLAARRGVVPPIANLAVPDPDCPLDLVRDEPRRIPVAPVLTNSFGFGGHNATLVLVPEP
ncbi:beta-ketoacyl synthase [Micromonospora sp. C95]|uniref:beta-ketoacyl-[acyl-carrier-protein] synthase family protein n=1 Tax=Micromonospora sp. C95 TaxID=2824882 RepID=UPI001B39723F|nr:beta-ketoacyl-[acyl-carrier-protein] synthase family protein [Micromonospora sp. C95]MBQ1026028.1 beta-ketoacyl-[acyl-carrier-protein] synthase family protein [Micromonospora sp. C95]